jgi:hypothetical protein
LARENGVDADSVEAEEFIKGELTKIKWTTFWTNKLSS